MDEGRRPPRPIVGLIGPTNLQRISAASGIPEAHYRGTAYAVGQVIAQSGAALAVVPDRGIALFGMQGYRDADGPWVVGLTPSGGPSESVATGNCLSNAAQCNEIVSGFTWHHQHARICEMCTLMVCVGLSCGTLAEIAWTKWVGGPRILAMRSTLTVLPKEILAETHIAFADSLEDLAERMAGMLCQTAES
jgi:predicted Rossmann-fold nucleotide-binding protein